MDDNKALLDRAPEIVAALRCCGNTDTKRPDCDHCPLNGYMCVKRMLEGAAALIEAYAAQPATVTAERDALDDALRDMVGQYCSYDGKLDHEFMSAGEHAFDVLDLDYGAPVETLWRGPQGAGEGGG